MTSKRDRNRVDLGGGYYRRIKTQEEINRENQDKELERLVDESEALKRQAYIEKLRNDNEEARVRLEQPQVNEISQQMPTPNENGKTWDDLFDWYYSGGIVGYPDIKDLTSAVPYASGTINNKHSLYVQQYGKKPRSKSK